MAKSTVAKTAFVLGEISPRCFGRFEGEKPIFKNGAALLENFMLFQSGGVFFRPGTQYIAALKSASAKARLQSFQYSVSQQYILEIGNLYMRFFANSGQVSVAGIPVEIVTVFEQVNLFQLQFANKSDVMYICHSSYWPQKLVRTSATSFTITDAPLVRGPFLDSNITTTTITPSADTGAGITLTASSAIFLAGHVKSLWRVKGGVVKITAFTSTTVLVGDVQAEPDGSAGNLGTGPGATADWAEGAFSGVRGYPSAVTFHEQRLVYGGTVYQPQRIFASQIAAYDNFSVGTAKDNEAFIFEISSNVVNAIRWLTTAEDLKIGTSGGTITARSLSATGMNATNPPQIIVDSDYGVMLADVQNISGYLFYLQSNSYTLRQTHFDLATNRDKSDDMTLLADHILRDGLGAVQSDRQQSPNDRIWVIRNDGQLAVFTRNVDQQVLGWFRFVAGTSSSVPGLFESVAIIPVDGGDDQIWVTVKRVINGATVRYVEMFTAEAFNNYWDPVRLDCSLTYDIPVVISGITNASPGVVTAIAHGFLNGDQVKIDQVVGMTQVNARYFFVANKTADTFQIVTDTGAAIDTTSYGTYLSSGQARKMNTVFSGLSHLNGETVSVAADGALPAAQQTYLVNGGAITLINPAAVVHIGLPYAGKIQLLPMGETSGGRTTQTKEHKLFKVFARVYNSINGNFGKDFSNYNPIQYPGQTPNVQPGSFYGLYTGDVELDFESEYARDWQPVFYHNSPLPFFLLALIMTSDIQDDK